ncbi:hypothetical protein LCGC14_2212090, partial [marine sediment metagenome]
VQYQILFLQYIDYIIKTVANPEDALFTFGDIDGGAGEGDMGSTGGTVVAVAMSILAPESLSVGANGIKGLMKETGTEALTLLDDDFNGQADVYYHFMPDGEAGAAWSAAEFNATQFGVRLGTDIDDYQAGTSSATDSTSLTDGGGGFGSSSEYVNQYVHSYTAGGAITGGIVTAHTDIKLTVSAGWSNGTPAIGEAYNVGAPVFCIIIHVAGDNLVRPNAAQACPAAGVRRIFVTS